MHSLLHVSVHVDHPQGACADPDFNIIKMHGTKIKKVNLHSLVSVYINVL
jgi:hypothetical protein